MTETKPKKRRYTDEDARRDLEVVTALHKPNWRTRILGLIAVGHPISHIVEIGKHHRSWSEQEVYEALATAGVRPPKPPFGGGAHPRKGARKVKLRAVEMDILAEMCTGAPPAIIAKRLFLAESFVTRTVDMLCQLLDADDRAQAIAYVTTGRVHPIPS